MPTDLQLARLFHEETAPATPAHVALIGVIVAFLWPYVPHALLLKMMGAVIVAAFVRFLVHRRARRWYDHARSLVRVTRVSTLLVAAVWVGVTLTLATELDEALWLRYLLAVAGIVAAANATHMADRLGYHIFSALIMGSAMGGTLIQHVGPGTVTEIGIIALYWGLMTWIHLRSHRQLVDRVVASAQLRAATEASVREKEFLDGVLESVPDAMALIDPAGRITRVNDEFVELVVPSSTAGEELTLESITSSGLGAVLARTVRTAREQGASERECRTSVGGEPGWFMAKAARAAGDADGWVFLQLRDITSVRSAEQAQRKAEADLADMVESAHDLIWRVDNRGRWTFLNSAAEHIYGVEVESLLGMNSLEMSPEEHRVTDQRAFKGILAGDSLVNHLTVHVRPDGERRWMSFSGSPLRDDTLAVVGAHGIARDVTAEVQAREALEQLAERDSLVRSLINASDDLVFYKDVDSVYRGCNDAFAEVMGVPEDELIGMRDSDLFAPTLAAHIRERDEEVMAGRAPIRYETHYHPDQPHRVWETVKTAFVSDDGEVLGVLGISREMTAWKEAQERMQKMAEQAEHAAQMKSAFLANMSHEIRTPMNGVLGMSELLQDTDLGSEQRQYVDVIRSSAENLLRILNDILDFSKIEAGHLELDSAPFDLHKEVGDAVRVMAIQASRRGNELMVDIESGVPRWVEGDPGRLRQIITNLVGNAVKFTEDGEVEVRVAIDDADADTPGGTRLRMQVRDSGIGIAEDKLALIFQEFSQADASVSRRYGGTGLGLAISRRLVRLMGGRMQVESREGAGSTFTFDVVLTPCDPPAEARPLTDAGPVDLSGMRVLVVDDNHTNRRILRGVLGEAGCTVHQADSGAAALHRLDELDAAGTAPDLIVMDVQMPEMDGLTVIERLRTDSRMSAFMRIPILVLTSANRPEDARRVRELGVEGYFLKPLPRPDLLRAVAGIRAGRSDDPEAEGPGVGLGAHLRRHRVLVVEDNAVNRMVACAVLEKAGYRVEIATNGVEAVAAVGDGDFQLVLMDVQMPEMDGLEATRVIRRAEAETGRRRLPIIALTAHALEEERERCLGAGMDDFLAKPFRAEDLLALLEQWTRSEAVSPDASSSLDESSMDATAPPASAASEEPPVDLDGFRSVLEAAGIVEVFETTLDIFRDDLPRRMEQIRSAWEARDVGAVAEAAHAIKSAAGNVQARRLNTLVADLESAGRAEDVGRMESLWPDVDAELDRVDRFLQTR
ncbi:response regulator [Gemmatimonadota bacterium DH-20]|uniref:histidine kinase n=1 Tax=Gaopeijia maritima TaxID=3119007 RepID=A0ABU9EAB6_9BACT